MADERTCARRCGADATGRHGTRPRHVRQTHRSSQTEESKRKKLNDVDFQLLKENKFRQMHTFFALYEPNRLMRRRQAETLLGRSVNSVETSFSSSSNGFFFSQFDPLLANDYRLPESNFSLIWIDQLKQLLAGPTFFIVHEYLNTFPIHKFHVTSRKRSSIDDFPSSNV